MRDIKFRAWDKRTKRLYQVQTLQFYGTNNTVDACWTNGVDFDGESTLGEPELNNLHNLELMQYTGMKDVKGVEIYEGDIVKRTYLFDGAFGKTHIGEVVYDNYYARHVISKPNKFIEPKTEDLGNMLSYKSAYEVIGNIYENPELLED